MTAPRLDEFTVTRSGDDYLLRLTIAGSLVEALVDYDRLDLIAEAIDARLDADGDDHDEAPDETE